MDKNDIINYIKQTPENTNPHVIESMLDSFAKDSADFTNLKGYKVEFKQWPEASVHDFNYVQTDGTIHEGEINSDTINNVVLLRFADSLLDSASGLVKKLNNTIIDLSEVSSLPNETLIPLSNIEITYYVETNLEE